MSDSAMRASDARPSSVALPTKVPRERIVTLRAQADHCPQVLLRILGLFAQHATVPLSIAADRDDDGLRIAVEIDTLPDATMAVLLAKVQAIVTVRLVEIERKDGSDRQV